MEEWSGNEPANWLTGNSEEFVFVTQSTDAHSGSFAIKLEEINLMGFLGQATISVGADGNGFPVSQRYNQVSLYYKFHKTVSTAYLILSAGFDKGEEGVGAGAVIINTEATQYTPVNIPITYINNDTPDRCLIIITVTDQNLSTSAIGSYALIDDLSFNLVSGVDDDNNLPKIFNLAQNFPNPFNPSTTIKYSVPETENVTLKVYDIIGNEIATLVNETKPAGEYEVKFSPDNQSSGIYIYRLQAGSQIQTRKMTFLK